METKKPTKWKILNVIFLPFVVLSVLVAALIFVQHEFWPNVLLGKIRSTVIILCVGWTGLRLIKFYEKFVNSVFGTVFKLSKTAVMVSVLLAVLSTFNISITSILALGGVSALAIGFAARDILANLLGYIVIHIDRPFVEGDHVSFGSVKGRVAKVGYRSTELVNDDGDKVSVPNSTFSSTPLTIKTSST